MHLKKMKKMTETKHSIKVEKQTQGSGSASYTAQRPITGSGRVSYTAQRPITSEKTRNKDKYTT